MKLFNKGQLPRAEYYWTFLSERGERILMEKTFDLPLSEVTVIQKSTEFFDDPDPCYIHRSAVMNRLYYEIEETAGKLPQGERLPTGSLPEQVLSYLKLPETAKYIQLSGRCPVNCFGDSLTFGYGGEGITYPAALSDLLGVKYQVNNLGIGGESTVTIAGRQGSIPIRVKAVTVPGKGEAAEVGFLTEWGEVPKPLRQGEAGVNPCYLKGIKGKLSITQSTTTSEDAKWYFTGEDTDTEIHIDEGEALVTQAGLYSRKGILVLWTGTNDGFKVPADDSIGRLLLKQKIMIDYLEDADKKYIVIGLTHKKNLAPLEVDGINKELKKVYGKHFLDIKTGLIKEGLQASGLTKTRQDRLDISQGNVPKSLRVDEVHLNAFGYRFIGQQVYKKGNRLGYC